ncbi:GHKL domain-containing protein [Paenibacillus qinlingensis]|nr:GHKL domain-containing protein [Paenibacillus qinlingensis]
MNFWIGITLIFGGMASFTFSIHLVIMPFILPLGWLTPSISSLIYQLSVVAMSIYFYLFPFAACMGALWIGAIESFKKRLLVSLLLSIPAIVVLFSDNLSTTPWGSFDISTFRWWAGFYLLLSYVFYYVAFRRATEYHEKRNKKRVGILFTIGTLCAFVFDFVGFRSLTLREWNFQLESNGAWKFNVVVILGLVAIIIFYSVKYGFLGIKLRIERDKLDYSMRALTMGVSILNHSIKNEIQKINYLTEKTEGFIHAGQTEKSLQAIEQIHSVSAHLLSMVGRIKDKAEDILLSESQIEVKKLLAEVILPMQPLLESRSVEIIWKQVEAGDLICDTIHMKETLSNLIHNAMDALGSRGGIITLQALKAKRYFIIEVKDNGVGIPKDQLTKIFEPFYTTKKNSHNYGLGLPYCLSVMRKHGGKLDIAETEMGKGTTVILQFPIQRYVD